MRELGHRLDARELEEWRQYYSLCPWGDDRDDLRFGILTSVVLNAMRKKGARPVKPLDVIPDWGGLRKAERRRAASNRGAVNVAALKQAWQSFAEAQKQGRVTVEPEGIEMPSLTSRRERDG